MKRIALAFAVLLSASAAPAALAQGGSTGFSQSLSNASNASLIGSGFVVAGTSQLIHGSAQLTVTALEAAGEAVVVVMRGASEATTVSVKASTSVVGAASVAVGSAVQVVAESAGNSLYVAGKLIAFIPNEIGRALIHQSKHTPVAQ
jgi:hypothetical protein